MHVRIRVDKTRYHKICLEGHLLDNDWTHSNAGIILDMHQPSVDSNTGSEYVSLSFKTK